MGVTANPLGGSGAADATSGVVARGLFDARVTHVRHSDVPYRLSHRVWYLNIPVDALSRLPWPWLGYDRRALVTLDDRDYGTGKGPLAGWIADALRTGGITNFQGSIRLVTMPRVLGLAFNPVSFWLCHDTEGGLRAVLAEVNSTFGERHCYLCRRADGAVIGAQDQIWARKLMYVSPFLSVEGDYRFRFHETADQLGIFISLVRSGRTVLFTSLVGRLSPLSARSLLTRMWRQPLPALRVLLLIHFHAARLYLRGLRIVPRAKGERPLVSVSQPVHESAEEAKCRPPSTCNR